MSVHVEVPGDFRQGQLNAVKLPSEKDLAAQPGVLLKHGRHVQHVILPRTPKISVNIYGDLSFTASHKFVDIKIGKDCL